MRVKINKILEYLYLIILVSIFLKIKIYPIIMLVFIFFTIYNYKFNYNFKIIKENLYIFLFLILSIFNFIIFNKNLENISYIFKLVINIGFLLAFKMNNSIFTENKSIEKIMKVIKFLIIGTFLQILLLYFIKDISLFQFMNTHGSGDAYIVNFQNVPFLLGNENKNIWSTKIIFLEIILLTYWYKKEKINYFYMFLILFNCVTLLSRTGYLALTIYFCVLFFNYILKVIKKIKNGKYLIIIFFIIFIPIFFINLDILFEKIVRVDFSSFKLEEYLKKENDGGVSRLINWIVFFKYYFQDSPILGVGLGNTQKFLIKYGGFPDGNMHNFLLNCFLEQGLIIGIIYILFHFEFIKKVIKNLKIESLMLLLPFYAVISLHYLGYDNDIVIYLSLVSILIKFFKKEANK